MTIAACYVSPEGVVLGADSTTTYFTADGPHYYNHAQKIFELGEDGTLGVVTWGLGGLHLISHRTLFAHLADDLAANPPADVQDAATRWADLFWSVYSDPNSGIAAAIAQFRTLDAKPAYDSATPNPAGRTADEESVFRQLSLHLVAGFCIAGHVLPDRVPTAFEVIFTPQLNAAPTPVLKVPGYWFWGAPNMIQRMFFACDDQFKDTILASGKWTGTRAELDALALSQSLSHPTIPIREAIDFVHSCIYGTIKALKFSFQSQICGGPIELAVITTDRRYRWVRHKPWDAAINEGDLS